MRAVVWEGKANVKVASVPDPEITDEQRREASLEVALDLIQTD